MKPTLTVKQVAAMLKITPHGVRNLIRSGKLAAKRFGDHGPHCFYLIAPEAVEQLPAERRGRPKKHAE